MRLDLSVYWGPENEARPICTLKGVGNGTDTRTVNWSYIGLILKALQVIVINLP